MNLFGLPPHACLLKVCYPAHTKTKGRTITRVVMCGICKLFHTSARFSTIPYKWNEQFYLFESEILQPDGNGKRLISPLSERLGVPLKVGRKETT